MRTEENEGKAFDTLSLCMSVARKFQAMQFKQSNYDAMSSVGQVFVAVKK